ncbi:hypothetical protein A0H81_11113 [Grifola frondosa]|uniref:Ribonuclease H1 N-terminal domain-containing protein n=1 Tax=Grifola frondosa TaxID=5627 RepID=A0A1C7LXJ2_GRIFR|nr:hypothetical protein A0H81_11113 [Grifola frondosa]
MARTDRNAKGGESSKGSPTFTLSQLADALHAIMAQEQQQPTRTSQDARDASDNSSSQNTSSTSHSTVVASAGQSSDSTEGTASADTESTRSAGSTPSLPSLGEMTPSPPSSPSPSPPAEPQSRLTSPKGLPAAFTPGAASASGQGGAAVLTTAHPIPMGIQAPNVAVAIGVPTLPTGSYGLISGPPIPSTSERWYAVTRGRQVGVFEGWSNVSPLVTGVSFAIAQRYSSQAAAQAAFNAALAAGTVVVLP